MTVLKIFHLDDQEETSPITEYSEGEHVIGRDKLNCKDQRVSRNHALIIITPDSITLKATHMNPSFYKPYGGNSIQLITKDNIVVLKDKDQFALLPNEYWFRIRIDYAEDSLESKGCLKRFLKDEEDINNSKKLKSDYSDESLNNSNESIDFANFLQDNSTADISTKTIENNTNFEEVEKSDLDTNHLNTSGTCTSQLNRSDSNESLDFAKLATETQTNVPEEINNLPETELEIDNKKHDSDTDTHNATANNSKPKRERCWYGEKCYRKNPNHRETFSHPGDTDYETLEDDLPICPFGDACYRTNINHRQQFKHSKPPAPKPMNNNSHVLNQETESDDDSDGGNKRKRKAAMKAKYTDSPDDDYDYEDPFINDASSDDFEITDEESNDSDFLDSQEVEEDTQEKKRLIKEAKRFVKKKT